MSNNEYFKDQKRNNLNGLKMTLLRGTVRIIFHKTDNTFH